MKLKNSIEKYIFIYGHARSLLLHVLSLVVASGGYSVISVCGLLIAVASLVAEHGLQSLWASVVDILGLSCSVACEIFLDRGSNLGSLHWQMDS